KEVQDDRIGTATEFAVKWGVTVVLKGAGTVVALPDSRVFVNSTGNPGMATGGSGDVLAGIIASLAGQGVEPSEAAIAGVYLHGLAGDEAAAIKGEHGMIAGDIIECLPQAVMKLAPAPGSRSGGTDGL
ncbi:MAG: NAD(P)H-hydrate dehydratase, partial [Clostridiales bacterium]|nr:NAD(P)H-hydrate dehydratase [Clostridiales bacterium]